MPETAALTVMNTDMSAQSVLLKILSGTIRGPYVDFRLEHPAAFSGWAHLSIEFDFFGGGVTVSSATQARRKATSEGSSLRLKIPQKGTLSAIRLVSNAPEMVEIAAPVGGDSGLSALYPLDDGKEMPEALSRANTVRDVETLHFILTQIVNGTDHTDYAKTEVVKKFAYKCMQNGTDEDTRKAIVLIDSMWHLVDRFDERFGKKNPVHLRVSFLFIRMLCHVTIGDFEAGLADMETIFELRTLVPEVPLIGTNLCCALLLFAWALGMGGQRRRAGIMFDATIAAFREAAYHMPARRQRPFAELSMPLRCASQAIGCVVALRKEGEWDGEPGVLYMVREYSRLEGPAAHKRLAAQLQGLSLHIKVHGAERNWTTGLA